jgi:hypothetical protein
MVFAIIHIFLFLPAITLQQECYPTKKQLPRNGPEQEGKGTADEEAAE